MESNVDDKLALHWPDSSLLQQPGLSMKQGLRLDILKIAAGFSLLVFLSLLDCSSRGQGCLTREGI